MYEAWRRFRERVDLDEYDARWDRMAASGEPVHGEADFIMAMGAASVLDAGCGTGRVAIELARRGVDLVGVDADPDMLDRARRRAPGLSWVLADLAEFDLGRTFDLVVLAGNVLPFIEPADRPAAVRCCARHLDVGGRLVTGASLPSGWPTVDDLDRWFAEADLALESRYGGWARERWAPGGAYAVTVSRRAAQAPPT